jgi:hypothetical protein
MKNALLISVLLGGTALAQADAVSDWKAANFPADAGRSFLSVSNGAVEVHVNENMDESGGRFTIGTAAGEYLLYGHGWDPGTSWVKLSVDGVAIPMGIPLATYISGNSIVTHWPLGDILLSQTLTPVLVDGEGTVRIEYDVENLGSVAHDVGVLLQMDTMVDQNDAAPISTSAGYAAIETCFDGVDVPNSWQAFEEGPNQDPSLLVGCGILNGFGATLPDRFAVGRWSWFYSADFNYVCEPVGYGDSAVLLWWSAEALAPGATDHFQTYYGTCTQVAVPGELSLSLTGTQALSCENGEINPNPFDVNLLVTNTGAQPCYAVMANVTTNAGLAGGGLLPVGDLYPGQTVQVGLFLTALDEYCGGYGAFSIEVFSQTCPSNNISRELYIPCCEVVSADDQPVAYGLGANYPNPFNPATTISFSMAETGQASLSVHNLTGETVATLWNGLAQRGTHEVVFDASALPSGLYLYTLTSAQGVQTRKMVLAK